METIQHTQQKTEILAPAGSFDCCRAAFAAGADAVYAGGSRFSARAFAENFTEEQLLAAIDYAHLHGRKFYLTVNTLLKDKELKELEGFLEPLYYGGLDAVIVQDAGVFSFIKEHFPKLDIHASTQMAVTGEDGAGFLRDRGAVRVVLARELSLEEIRRIKEVVQIEVECFVHGALCYCYSGQCLMSSLIGGRSGNRGQCAQPCRLPYNAGKEKGYFLSMKDLCTLELLPDLVEAGIDSFKIEGRMKRPEYVAGVTALYRKYLDLYMEKGRKEYRVEQEDMEQLLDLFNRGGFHTGYYRQNNGQNMLAVNRSNHRGVPVLRVTGVKGNRLAAQTLTSLHKGDVLEVPGFKNPYTFGEAHKKGEKLFLPAVKSTAIKPGDTLYRTHNRQLLEELKERYLFGKIQEKIYGFLKLSVGKPATLIVKLKKIQVKEDSVIPVEKALESPLDAARIRGQMLKTGNTEFVFESLEIEMEGEVFLPVQQLKDLRRRALEQLQEKFCRQFHRTKAAEPINGSVLQEGPVLEQDCDSAGRLQLSVLAENKKQLECFLDFPEIERIYADSSLNGNLFADTEAQALLKKFQEMGKQVYLALPHIFRKRTRDFFFPLLKSGVLQQFDGVLVRNFEEFSFLKAFGYEGEYILDYMLYSMNQKTFTFWNEAGISLFTLPVELNRQEILHLGAAGKAEIIAYAHLPVMVSAQCTVSVIEGCNKPGQLSMLTDRCGNAFPVKAFCRDCYSVIYNPIPLNLADQKKALDEISPAGYRLQFTVEDAFKTRKVLKCFREVFLENKECVLPSEKFTRGHFKRGVQ